MHAQLSSGARGLNFGPSLYLCSYFECAGSDETVKITDSKKPSLLSNTISTKISRTGLIVVGVKHSTTEQLHSIKINYRLMQVKSFAECSHSAILLTFIKHSFVIKIFVLSIFEWSFYTGFTIYEL